MAFWLDLCDDCRLAFGIKREDAAHWAPPARTPDIVHSTGCDVCQDKTKASVRFDKPEVLIVAIMRERLQAACDKLVYPPDDA